MTHSVAIALLLAGLCGVAGAQATPAGTVSGTESNAAGSAGPHYPAIDGNFQYTLSASEIVQFGYYNTSGAAPATNLSGDLEYLSRSTVHPFSVLYAGGYFFGSSQTQGNGTFQSLTVSQGLVARAWSINISEALSYLPQSPTTGLAGIPGVGDQGLQPQPDPSVPAQSVLTNYGRRVSNSANLNLSRSLSNRTTLNGSASYGGLYFVGDSGSNGSSTVNPSNINSTQITGQLGLNRTLDARSSVGLSAQYSTFRYSVTSFNVRSLLVSYNRNLSRNLSVQGSVGPQWTSSFQSLPFNGSSGQAASVPGGVSLSANLGVTYRKRFTSYNLHYSRGVNSGSGVQAGAVADGVGGGVSRSFGRDWSASATGNYTRTSGLANQGTTSTVYAGGQVTRRISHSFSGYTSFTVQHQSIGQGLVNTNAYNGTSETLGFGISYSPRMNRLGQF